MMFGPGSYFKYIGAMISDLVPNTFRSNETFCNLLTYNEMVLNALLNSFKIEK